MLFVCSTSTGSLVTIESLWHSILNLNRSSPFRIQGIISIFSDANYTPMPQILRERTPVRIDPRIGIHIRACKRSVSVTSKICFQSAHTHLSPHTNAQIQP